MAFKIGDKVVRADGTDPEVGKVCLLPEGKFNSNKGRVRVKWSQRRTWIREDRLVLVSPAVSAQ